jgi:DNA-binding MarR family transcriptional regulator
MARESESAVPDSAQAIEVVTAVVRLLRQANTAPSVSAQGGLSLTDFRLLKRIAQRARLASELAAEMDLTPATVSAAVDGLARRGLVRRNDSGGDRRAVPLTATPEGCAVLEAARDRQHEALAALIDRLRPAERRALAVALDGLERVLLPEGGAALHAAGAGTRRRPPAT